MYKNCFKHIIDFSLSLVGLIALSPIFLIVLILLFINNLGKPFFFQKRFSKKNEIFKVIKFKTMNDKKNRQGNLLPDGDRFIPLGKFIRKTFLNELRQLINVLKRDMNIIGFRHLLPEYLPLLIHTEKLEKLTENYVVSNAKMKKAISEELPLTTIREVIKQTTLSLSSQK